MRFMASVRVGHLIYCIGELGHNNSGFRYHPLLSHRIIVSIGLLALLSSFCVVVVDRFLALSIVLGTVVNVLLALLSSFCGVVDVDSGWFLGTFSLLVSSVPGRLEVSLFSTSKLFDVGML